MGFNSGFKGLKWICSNFLGRKKYLEFSADIQTLPNACKEMRSRMLLEVLVFAFTFRFLSRKPY